MPTAAVIYCSATWTTAGLAEDIAGHPRERGLEAMVASFDECDAAALADVDYLFLGCWTHGLFVVGQHPEKVWVEFARGLPRLERPRVALFTTYKILTGSMFRRMRRELRDKAPRIGLELKSRGTRLTDDGRRALDRFLEAT
jgi:sulfite reductase alpha subunit-like flavoprotein